MNCPKCGVTSSVLDSRETPAGMKRRRLCYNEHLFVTLEVAAVKVRGRKGFTPLALLELQRRVVAIATAIGLENPEAAVLPNGQPPSRGRSNIK